jgi:hypothetical protein
MALLTGWWAASRYVKCILIKSALESCSWFPISRLCGQVEYQSDATRVVSNQMRKCDRKWITEDSVRNVPALVKRPNGIEGVLGPDVHLAFADCRSGVDVRVEFIDRQNFPIASRTQHDDLAMLAGEVDLAVHADG